MKTTAIVVLSFITLLVCIGVLEFCLHPEAEKYDAIDCTEAMDANPSVAMRNLTACHEFIKTKKPHAYTRKELLR